MTKQCRMKKSFFHEMILRTIEFQPCFEFIPTVLGFVANLALVKESEWMHVDSVSFMNSKQDLESFPCKVRIYRFIFWKHTYKQIQARLETSPSKVGINSNLSWTCVQPCLELVLSSLGIIANLAWTCFQPCSEFLDIYLSTPSSSSLHIPN